MIRWRRVARSLAFVTILSGAVAAEEAPFRLLAIEDLVERIQHPIEAPDRAQAAEALARRGEEATPIFRELLASDDPGVRYTACLGLGRCGASAKDAVADLHRIAADPHDPLREAAVYALSAIGPAAASAAPTLRELAASDNRRLRVVALRALRSFGHDAAPFLAALLQHPDAEVRRQAAHSLQDFDFGPAAPDVAAALGRAVNDSDEEVCDHAATALSTSGAHAIPPLQELLRDNRTATRRRAASALSRLAPTVAGDDADNAADALRRSVHDSDPVVRFWSAKALGAMANATPSTVNALIAALRDSDADVRWQAATSLARWEAQAAAHNALTRLLDDPNPAVQAQAERILNRSPSGR